MRAGSWSSTISVGLVNQIVTSATNFLLSLYLVRVLTLADFGLWTLAFSGLLLITGLANGALFTPMVVGYAARGRRRADVWTGSLLIATVLLACIVGLFAQFAGLLISGAGWFAGDNYGIPGMAGSFGVAAGAVVIVHYFVRLAFCRQVEWLALAMNTIVMFVLAGLLAMMHAYGWSIDAKRVLTVYAIAHIGAILFAVPFIRLPGASRALWFRHFQLAWRNGRWASAGVWVSWAQSQIYMYLVPLLSSLSALGMINAARILAAPIIMLAPAINQIALPRISRMHRNNSAGVRLLATRTATVLALVALAYALIIAVFFELVADLLIGHSDADLYPIALAWCAFAGITLLRQLATVWMQAAERFFELFVCEASMLVVTVLLIGVLMAQIGLPGAVLATAIGEALIAILVWRRLVSTRTSTGNSTDQMHADS